MSAFAERREPPALDRVTVGGSRSTYAAFIASGFAFASWASRIPQVKAGLGLTPAQLGLLLLSIAAGSVVALPLAGPLVGRIGSRATVTGMSVALGVGLAIAAVGYRVDVWMVVAGLFVLGFANGSWDVAMNVQGALVERRLGRSVMSRFHAGYSLGTVAGAGLGAALVAVHVPVTVHLVLVAALVAATVPVTTRRFVPDDSVPDGPMTGGEPARSTAAQAWSEPRTLLVGLFVLAFALGEGAGNDWINVAVVDDYRSLAVVGTLTFALFLAAMTTGRWFGPGLLDRFGRVGVLRVLAVVAVAGIALFAFGGSVAAFGGAVLWGLGVSLGFPVGMSAGADDPSRAAARVSVIASIGYVAFLGGPPAIGFLADEFSVLHALLAVGVLLVVATTVAGALRPVAAHDGHTSVPSGSSRASRVRR